MQILIFSWRGPKHPNFGGAEIVTLQHAKAWVAAGHQVTLFTSQVPGEASEEVVDGISIIRHGHQLGTVHLGAIIWYWFVPHPKYDLVIDQFHGIPFFTPLFFCGKKLAFIHEVAREVWLSNHLKFPFNYIFGVVGYLAEPIIFWLYRRIPFLTVSESTSQDLVDLGIPKANISVIHSGATFYQGRFSKNSKPTIAYLGAIARDKGIEDALQVFFNLATVHPTWRFWVVGKGEPHYMSQLPKSLNVKFWGFVSERKKFELLAKSWALLNPSHREGWGLVNIEANSMGTPVIGYNVPGCRDSIVDGQTGFLCPLGDIQCLVNQCQEVLTDGKVFASVSKSALNWSRRFQWSISTSQSLQLISKLASSSRSRQKS